MKPFSLPLILLIPILLLSCQDNISDTERITELPRELTADETELIESGNSFSYDLFRQVHAAEGEEGAEPENIFISPLSVSMALGMTINGAAGETRTEMKQALRNEGMEMDEINASYRSLIELLVNLDPEVQMNIANSLWYDAGLAPKEAFRETLREYFDARVEGVDFADPATVDQINGWVSEQTEGLIEEIVKPPIDPNMIAYLINAIYFKGTWMNPFDEEDTREVPFTLQNGDTVQAELMFRSDQDHLIHQNDQVEMLDIPYGDSLFSMTLMMPADETVPLSSFIEENMHPAVVNGWIEEARARSNLDIAIPKFRVEYDVQLPEVMKALGMEQAFSEVEADFSDMHDGPHRIFISEIRHKTFIEVNEEGTEAAAATSVGIELTSAPPTLAFNRPFVYLIRERISGTILFMGTMQNPAGE